jgi:cytochrome b6-f complex iron-sulfur subunit
MNDEPKKGMTRRNFLDTLLGISAVGWLGTILYPVFKFLETPALGETEVTSVVAANIKDLKPNSGIVFKFGHDPGILILGPDGKLRAFTAVCTHLACTVQYRSDLERIWCACHNGIYDLSGRNVSGPPPRPLTQYTVTQKGDDVIVSRA